MRKLSFEAFLKQYLIDVSGQKSLSIHKLAKLSKNNIRIIDPLVLYCVLNGKKEVLLKYLNKSEFEFIDGLNKNNYLDDAFNDYSFKKIYQSYERKVNCVTYDNQTKSLIRDNILKMMSEKKISNYRVYKDLSLNPGNVNDYLTNGNPKKVSLKLVEDIYDYCLNY